MDRNSIIAVVFVISVIVAGGSLRVLAAAGVEKDPPSPTPLPLMKGDAPKKNLSDSKPSHTLTKSDPNLTDSPKLNSSTPGDPPVSSLTPPGSDGKNHKDKNKDGTSTPISDTSEKKVQEDEVCKDSAKNCKKGKLTACFQDSGQASKQLFLLVKNEGEDTLKVNISVPASAKIDKKQLPLYKHTHEKINISANDGENLKIVVSAGNGDCILQLQRTHASAGAPASAAEFFKRLPSYATHMTPIYGAYLFFLTALIIGGTWACCKFGKRGRRDGGGVPYQELEMGLPQSSSAVGVDSADGWDQGWDDDWEEEKGTSRMPEVRRAGNVSANGLTSRSPNREGWDDDWDD